jgi:hypothetical protein
MLPVNSLDYSSQWECGISDDGSRGCLHRMTSEVAEAIVDPIEEELECINSSGQFELYSDFIANYADILLHKNHYIIMTAARNLVQWYTYKGGQISEKALLEKADLCKKLDNILGRIDPGYSEIRSFIQKELHFTTLVLNQQSVESGLIDRETYLEVTRISMKALDELDRYKSLIKFNCILETVE